MITTITLNPAVDKTIEINNFSVGNVNRVTSVRLDAGGKGINVSKVIKSLGSKSRAMGILSGKSGEFIKGYLDGIQILNDFIFTQGETRTNTKVVDPINHTNTDINEAGPEASLKDLNELNDKIFNDMKSEDMIILSGSVPSNVDKKIYGEWIVRAKEKGAKTVLDADGELLKYGILSGPYLVKPNIDELEGMFNKKINGIAETVEIAKSLLEYGIIIVAVSLGSEGAIFVNKECAIYARGLKVDVKSTVGAGDSMVAALAYSIEKGLSFEETVKLAVATGAANVMTEGTKASDIKTIIELEKQVEFEYL
ncbi:1-phosphofructokinase [Clostridium lacusfryxellense]|uniref:1-phosphofructokinase n=1 Tax=Clostridium lacusfryxellense TaxID=205328 RepID=UPI001C0AD456|nr:1-phosphofructokinase [Clostridium lacusfryxellense]MBU3112726.1 1-phosphofructokinase [Clostridium lacusfryxellense]